MGRPNAARIAYLSAAALTSQKGGLPSREIPQAQTCHPRPSGRGGPPSPVSLARRSLFSRARTRPGGSCEAARRPDGTTTMGRERLPWERSRGTTTDANFEMRSGIGIERRNLP